LDRQLLHPEQINTEKGDVANHYTSTHWTVGKYMIDLMRDRIRKLTDDCAGIKGFLIFYGFGGVTAAGFGWLLLERFLIDSGKKSKLGFNVYPARQCLPR
jgi:tubulin alpha